MSATTASLLTLLIATATTLAGVRIGVWLRERNR